MGEVLPELDTIALAELSHFKQPENFDMKTYISVKGIIFDITDHALFHPEGKYYKLAGTEASVALAKSDLSDKYINNIDISQLTITERKYLNQHYLHFSQDYKVVGYLKEWMDRYGFENKSPPIPKEKPKRVLGVDTRKTKEVEENDPTSKMEKITIPPSAKEIPPPKSEVEKPAPRNRKTKK